MAGLDFWLQWQVLVCALIIILPAVIAVRFIKRVCKNSDQTLKSTDLWLPCWKALSPRWLLFYRGFAFVSMVFLLYQACSRSGLFEFLFYTQWTFALVVLYFALGTIVSARGCWMYSKNPLPQRGERDKFLEIDQEEGSHGTTIGSDDKEAKGSVKLQGRLSQMSFEQMPGFLENSMHVVYQTCAGAVFLTDIVFWCLLVPFVMDESDKLTLIDGCMHSVNAIFLLLDLVMNSQQFTWHGFIYFVLWTSAYVVFQWVLHSCCFTWWPYPFMELSTPWAPFWYLTMTLVHVPCYGIYVMLTKAKGSIFSRTCPQAFVTRY